MVFGGDKGQKFGKIKNGKSDEEERGKTCVARPNTRRSLVGECNRKRCVCFIDVLSFRFENSSTRGMERSYRILAWWGSEFDECNEISIRNFSLKKNIQLDRQEMKEIEENVKM